MARSVCGFGHSILPVFWFALESVRAYGLHAWQEESIAQNCGVLWFPLVSE
jgi:hypothetical protein